MITKVFCTISLFIASAAAYGECARGLVAVRDGARLPYLEVGAYIVFNEDIEVPTFTTSKSVAQNISLYLNPAANPRFIPKNKYYKIDRSSDYMLGTDKFELYFNPNDTATVGELRDNTGGKIEICRKDLAASAI